MGMINNFLALTLQLSVPIILGALCGTIAERGGVVMLGVEGMMLIGSFAGAVGSYFYWFCTGRSCDFRCFRCSNGLDLWPVLSEMESPAVCSWCRCKPVCKRHYSRYVKGNLEYRGNERFCTVYL